VQHAGVDEQPGGGEQRVGAQVGGDLLGPAVAGLDVGAGVGHEADGAQVQERGPAVPAHPRRRGAAVCTASTRSQPVGGEVLEPGRLPYACATQPSGVGTLMPMPLSSQTSSSGIGRPR
jgi:hypothetical protein